MACLMASTAMARVLRLERRLYSVSPTPTMQYLSLSDTIGLLAGWRGWSGRCDCSRGYRTNQANGRRGYRTNHANGPAPRALTPARARATMRYLDALAPRLRHRRHLHGLRPPARGHRRRRRRQA